MRGEKDIVAIQVGQGNVGSEALLGVDQHVSGFGLGLSQLQYFLEGNPLPVVFQAAPAGNAVECALCSRDAQTVECISTHLDGRFSPSPNSNFRRLVIIPWNRVI